MRYSVITPIYNAEKCIDNAVMSVINQTYDDWELILVDDGSTDNSYSKCLSFSEIDKRITVIQQKNQGPVSARSHGIRCATGEFIVNLDADDILDIHMMKRINEVVEVYNPDIVSFQYVCFWDADKIVQTEPGGGDKCIENDQLSNIQEKLLYDQTQRILNGGSVNFSCWSKVIRKSIIDKYIDRMPKEVFCGEDGCLSIPALYFCSRYYVIKDVLYYYRTNASSMTHTFRVNEIYGYDLLIQYFKSIINVPDTNYYGFAMYLTNVYLSNAVLSTDSYSHFKKFALKNWKNSDICGLCKLFRPQKLTIKDSIKVKLITHELWRTYWICHKMRKH